MTDEKSAESTKKTGAKVNLWQQGDPDLRVRMIAESVQEKTLKADSSLRVDVKKGKKRSD